MWMLGGSQYLGKSSSIIMYNNDLPHARLSEHLFQATDFISESGLGQVELVLLTWTNTRNL